MCPGLLNEIDLNHYLQTKIQFSRSQFISQGDWRLEFQEILSNFLALCFLTFFINIWHIGDTVIMIILSRIILKSARNCFLNNYYKHLPLIFPCKVSKLSFLLDSRRLFSCFLEQIIRNCQPKHLNWQEAAHSVFDRESHGESRWVAENNLRT